jgi:hypothetical protein
LFVDGQFVEQVKNANSVEQYGHAKSEAYKERVAKQKVFIFTIYLKSNQKKKKRVI